MSQTNVREGYRIMTLEVVKLVEDLISYLLKSLRLLTSKDWLAVAKCTRLRNAQIPKVFYEAAAGTIWTMMLAKVRYNTLTLTLSETAQRRSSSVVSNRSTALITDKFSVASLTEPAILNDANVALVDAVHYSVVIDALTMTLIKDDDDLLGTVNSHIKSRRLRAVMLLCQTTKLLGDSNKDGPPLKRCKTEAADSRYAKASGGRTKKDKDSEDSDTSSDVLRLRRRDRAAACARSAKRKRLLDSDDYRSDSSSDIDPKDDSEDEEATTAKDLNEGRSLCKSRDGNRTLHSRRLIDAYILYFKELLSNNGGIFANAIGIGKMRAMVLAVLMGHVHFKNWTEVQNARAEGDATEHNAVNDNDKLCPTKGERTFYCACERSLSFNAEPRQAATIMTGWGRAADAWKNEVVAIDLANSTWCDSSDPLALYYVLGGVDHRETVYWIIPEANTPAVHSKATKHCLALSAARFVIVCGFRKVDKHVFRAYNTMSVTAQRTIIRKGGPYVEKRAILLPGYVTVWGQTKAWALSGTPMEQGLNKILIFVSLALIGLQNRKGVSNYRRVIFNRFEIQAIAFYSALATLKAAQFKTYGSCKVKRFTLNSVKDLFTNLSKDYFLVREARAITKSSLKFQNLSNLCSEVEILGTLSRTWSIAVEDAAKAANTLLPPKEVRAKILIGSYKLIVQARDLDGPWIIVASMAFAEAITLTEATHVVIIELQDRQNTQDQFMF
ncbi:hypothetical protein HBH51_235670 [Parastagonospora nodorum]|nr:hypothetical protein HBH51_235670 [Parastagonospora nodorum]